MKEIVEALKKRISENKNSMLVTVVAGRGSIPRKAGAYMVVGEDGRVTGTIGGGNLEYQATLMGQKLLAEKKNPGLSFPIWCGHCGSPVPGSTMSGKALSVLPACAG